MFFHAVYHALKIASWQNGCVRYSRNYNKTNKTKLQVIECCIELGLAVDIRSPPGSPKESRLVPSPSFQQYDDDCDPWDFEIVLESGLVELRNRKSKNPMRFRKSDSVPSRCWKLLERTNAVNEQHKITYKPALSNGDGSSKKRKRLRPHHYCVFTGDFMHHGRIYAGRFGHLELSKIERRTIKFDGKASVELDYSGMHPRLLYHKYEEIDYREDPYAFWGKRTTKKMRAPAKKILNAAINAASPEAAYGSCNSALRKSRVTPSKRIEAIKLRKALDRTGLSFKGLYHLCLEKHEPIAQYFGTDIGMQLMRLDSIIALSVLEHFSEMCIPCLSVHDSFIVPKRHKHELKQAMLSAYFKETGFEPLIN